MRISYRALCLLVLLILAAPVVAVPATALAQSAGDDQYVDPFENDGNGNGNGGNSGNQGSDQGTSNDTSAQSGDQSGNGTAGTAAQGTEDPNGKLPRTGGVPEGWIAVAGVALLLGGGFALRRVWPRPD
jgi:LPXTG-motif cell wall-anchored protein